MSGRQELQALSQQLEEIQGQIEALKTTVQTLRSQQTEIDEATDAIDTLESGSVVQVPLGGGAYVRATIDDIDEVIVDLGADYAAEFEREGAIEALENRHDLVGERIDEVTEQIGELESESAQVEQRAQQMQQQALQQQMQQMQGQGQGPGPDAEN